MKKIKRPRCGTCGSHAVLALCTECMKTGKMESSEGWGSFAEVVFIQHELEHRGQDWRRATNVAWRQARAYHHDDRPETAVKFLAEEISNYLIDQAPTGVFAGAIYAEVTDNFDAQAVAHKLLRLFVPNYKGRTEP